MGDRGTTGKIAALTAMALIGALPVAMAHAEPLTPGGGPFTLLAADPTLSVADVQVAEGNAEITTETVDVTLSAASAQPVTVGYIMEAGTATAGSDFGGPFGTVTFDPGQTSRQISVEAWGDIYDEDDETFFVRLTNPVGASLADADATATILDDDPTPVVTISDAPAPVEGTGGSNFVTLAQFTLNFSSLSRRRVEVDCDVVLGTASSDDLDPVGCPLVFPYGVGDREYLQVGVVRDAVPEDDETFGVLLTGAVNAVIGDADLGVTGILDDDEPEPPPPPPPTPRTISVNDVQVVEGTAAGTVASWSTWNTAVFTISLSSPHTRDVKVGWRVISETAIPADFAFPDRLNGGTLTIPAGDTSANVGVAVAPDAVHEAAETFAFALTTTTNAAGGKTRGIGLILNDDPAPPPPPPPAPPTLGLDTNQMPKRLKLKSLCPAGRQGRPRAGAFTGTYELGLAAARTQATLKAEFPARKGKPKTTLTLGSRITKRVNPFSEDIRISIDRKRCARLLRAFPRGGKVTLVVSLGLTPVNAGVPAERRTLRIPLRR